LADLIEGNPKCTTREIANILNISHKSVSLNLRKFGMTNKYDVWVPQKLTENLVDRISVCDFLLKRHKSHPFLKQLLNGDEKWIVFNNVR
ncbi:Histone-lysine N-methyltransferase SETMAR, partial [Habropoda laboriosa]